MLSKIFVTSFPANSDTVAKISVTLIREPSRLSSLDTPAPETIIGTLIPPSETLDLPLENTARSITLLGVPLSPI